MSTSYLYSLPIEERKNRIKGYNYVRQGRGKRGKPQDSRCESCGEVRRLEGHHPSHDLPKIVLWVCRRCHRKLDEASYINRPRDNCGRFVRVERSA